MADSIPRYALALHTCTPELGLAIAPLTDIAFESSRFDNLRTQVWSLGHALSTQLHVALQTFIQPLHWSDIGLLAVARGPGGFTGTRVGVVAARTLGQQLDVPVVAVSSLAAAAWQARPPLPGEADSPPNALDMAVEMPARRGQVFAAVYRYDTSQGHGRAASHLIAKLSDAVLDQAEWQQMKRAWDVPYEEVDASGELGATVTGVLALGLAQWYWGDRPHWSEALPFYGQSPV